MDFIHFIRNSFSWSTIWSDSQHVGTFACNSQGKFLISTGRCKVNGVHLRESCSFKMATNLDRIKNINRIYEGSGSAIDRSWTEIQDDDAFGFRWWDRFCKSVQYRIVSGCVEVDQCKVCYLNQFVVRKILDDNLPFYREMGVSTCNIGLRSTLLDRLEKSNLMSPKVGSIMVSKNKIFFLLNFLFMFLCKYWKQNKNYPAPNFRQICFEES